MFVESLKGHILLKQILPFLLLWHSYQTKCETSKCMRHWMSIRWTTKKPYSLNLNKPINVHIKMEQPTQHQKIARKICNIIEASKTMATDCSTTFFYMFYIEFYFWLWDMYFWFYLFFPLWNAIIKWSMQINKCPTNWYEIGCQTWFQTKHNWVTVYFGIAFFLCVHVKNVGMWKKQCHSIIQI